MADAAIAVLDAEADARVEAMRERFLAIVKSYEGNRFKPSDSWRDDMSPADIYDTAASDICHWIAEEFAALPTKGSPT